MARALWKGAVTFGLVSIPVEVRTAVRDTGPDFRLLRAADKSRIRFQRVAERDQEVVNWDDLVKGYEVAKNRFVVLTREDFESAALERDRSIDILDFVNASKIDDRFFDKPYYLTPGAGGEKAYALLRETIRKSGRIGIGKFVMRNRQHLVAIEAIEDALVLSLLRFADELVDTSAYEFPPSRGLNKKDLDLALSLVENFASEWDPEKYTNEYRENLMRIIEAKRKGVEADLEKETVTPEGNVVDLMARLRQSLEASAGRRASGGSRGSAGGRRSKAAGARGSQRRQSKKAGRAGKSPKAA